MASGRWMPDAGAGLARMICSDAARDGDVAHCLYLVMSGHRSLTMSSITCRYLLLHIFRHCMGRIGVGQSVRGMAVGQATCFSPFARPGMDE